MSMQRHLLPLVACAVLAGAVARAEPAKPAPTGDDAAAVPSKEAQENKSLRGRIDELLVRGAEPVAIMELVEDTVDDLVADLAKLDAAQLSPLAVRSIELSPNLKSGFARHLEARVVAAVAQGTKIRQVHCAACRAMRSRVEDGHWVVSMGPVNQADLRRLGEELAVRSFLELDFAYSEVTNQITTLVRLVRASDGTILWSESYDSDGTTAALVRGSDRAQTRDERRAELQRLIDKQPYFGQSATVGVVWMPTKFPDKALAPTFLGGYRLYEKFGPDRKWQFGLQLEAAFEPDTPISGAFIGGQIYRQITADSLLLPDLKVGGGAGGFLAGSEGNTGWFEVGAELMLKFRFSAGLSAFYMIPAKYLTSELGGLGFKARFNFVW